jgi:hypothetical protein
MHLPNNRFLGAGNRQNPFLERLNERLFSSTAWKLSQAFSIPSAALPSLPVATLHAAAADIAGAFHFSICSLQFYVSTVFTFLKQNYGSKSAGLRSNSNSLKLPPGYADLDIAVSGLKIIRSVVTKVMLVLLPSWGALVLLGVLV